MLALTKTSFPLQQYKLLEGVLGIFVYVMQARQSARTSVRKFRNMLFGASTCRRAAGANAICSRCWTLADR